MSIVMEYVCKDLCVVDKPKTKINEISWGF